MSAEKKSKRMRIVGLQKDYKYKDWLDSVLNVPKPSLDYFKFADMFSDNKSATDSHYTDLLQKLSKKQSNKLTRITSDSYSLYNDRNNTSTDFGKKYKIYWEKRTDQSNLKRKLTLQNNQTIERPNEITNNEIIRLAGETCSSNKVCNEVRNEVCNEVAENYYESEARSDMESDVENSIDIALRQAADLASDLVGKLNIVDLSSTAAMKILEAEVGTDNFNEIIEATKTNPIPLSEYASYISDALYDTPLSVQSLRQKLYQTGFRDDFDPIIHSDGAFIEVTVRHFLDLMSSPQKPLNKLMLERTAASYLIIYIVNQLFLSNNDVIELGWLEREFYLTDRRKFDGILFKAGDKSISPALVEFAGGINDNTSSHKNSNDIRKLYVNITKIMKDTGVDRMFCMRCYDHQIFFEKLIKYNDTMYRIIDVSIEVPNTPRKLVAYVKEIPSIIAWKHAIINQIVEL